MPLASLAADLISGRTPSLASAFRGSSFPHTPRPHSFASTAHPNSVFPHEHHEAPGPPQTEPFTRRASPPPSSKAETTHSQWPEMTLGPDGYELDPSTGDKEEKPFKKGSSLFGAMRSLIDAATVPQDPAVEGVREGMSSFNR